MVDVSGETRRVNYSHMEGILPVRKESRNVEPKILGVPAIFGALIQMPKYYQSDLVDGETKQLAVVQAAATIPPCFRRDP
jgi:hypothetical protein